MSSSRRQEFPVPECWLLLKVKPKLQNHLGETRDSAISAFMIKGLICVSADESFVTTGFIP
jgi:hypothetical protein